MYGYHRRHCQLRTEDIGDDRDDRQRRPKTGIPAHDPGDERNEHDKDAVQQAYFRKKFHEFSGEQCGDADGEKENERNTAIKLV